MRCYFGYPESFCGKETFKLKDLFLDEINVDYSTVPVEVKRKLLSFLEQLDERDYLFIGNVFYDGLDILEFSLFSLPVREISEVVLPGYLYGKSTFLIKKLLKNSFGVSPSFLFDFNLFSRETLLLNVGYSVTSLSLGGNYLFSVPLGEYHFIDFLGSYLFNRFISEVGLSNSHLRRSGKRGELLDLFRSFAARVLFGRTSKLSLPEYGYEREIEEGEICKVLSPLIGNVTYGDYLKNTSTLSSFLVRSLYRFEELFKERFKVKEVVVLGRLTFPFKEALKKVFPLQVKELRGRELLKKGLKNRCFKVVFEKGALGKPSLDYENFQSFPNFEGEVTLKELRKFFNLKDLRGLELIEKLSSVGGEKVIYEFLSMLKRASFKKREEILYMEYLISALSKVEIPDKLLPKVIKEMEEKAFNWELPLSTKFNVLYFCYKYKDKIKGTFLEIFPTVFLTYVRAVKLSEGERNFVKTVSEQVLSGS